MFALVCPVVVVALVAGIELAEDFEADRQLHRLVSMEIVFVTLLYLLHFRTMKTFFVVHKSINTQENTQKLEKFQMKLWNFHEFLY